MAQKNLIVTLEREGDDSCILKKGVSNCLERSFENVLGYILDSSEDNDNPPYNDDEKDFCSSINELRNTESSEIFFLRYKNGEDKISTPITDLTQNLGNYPDIVADKMEKLPTGGEVTYKGVALIAGVIPYGGF